MGVLTKLIYLGVLVSTVSASSEKSVDYFHTGIFQAKRDQGIYQVDIGLSDDVIPAAYGYFDDDKYCDLVVLNSDQTEVEVYIWSQNNLTFEREKSLHLEKGELIQNVIPGDYDYDGSLDLLVTLQSGQVDIHLQKPTGWNIHDSISIVQGSQPSVFDIDGDFHLEIIANLDETIDGPVDEAPYVISRAKDGYKHKTFAKYASSAGDCKPLHYIKALSTPYTMAFVDLNKDCMADIFMTVEGVDGQQQIQIWLNMDVDGGKYCLRGVYDAPEGMGQVSFTDLDEDGQIDLVFPTNVKSGKKTNGYIHVLHNTNENSDTCTYHDVEDWSFDLSDIEFTETKGQKKVIPIEEAFYSKDSNFPINISLGDVNSDGRPMLMMVIAKSPSDNASARVVLYEYSDQTYKILDDKDYEDIYKLRNVVSANFFDIDENGDLDILVTTYDITQISINKAEIHAFYNNLLTDSFHLKSQALNGKHSYSSTYPGCHFKFIIVNPDMEVLDFYGVQQPRSAYRAMETPYVIFGLGRVTSYVENFSVAVPTYSYSTRTWTPIIPNSYLIANPSQESLSGWELELFASLTDNIVYIIGACLICLLIIGIIIVVKLRKEKKDDIGSQPAIPF